MKKQLWNDGWKYFEGKDSFSLVWSVPESAKSVTLPFDSMREHPADPESRNGGNTGYRNGESSVFVKLFTAPQEWRGKKVQLCFEGVYMNAFVYLNEQLVARNPYGYTGFTADLTPYLRLGKENEIRVLVKTSAEPNSRWYSGSGILRDVWLFTSECTCLPDQGLRIRTLDADPDLAVLLAETEVRNDSVYPRDLSLVIRLMQKDAACGEETVRFFLKPGESRTVRARISVPHPLLWSDETPDLYCAQAVLSSSDGTAFDEETASFGIRTLSLDSTRGLRVNGKTVKLRGACIHHDSGILGAAVYYGEALRKMKALKKAGFNAVRMSHQPAAESWLEACDEAGLYVMDELTDMWNRSKSDYDYSLFFADRWQKDAASMVRKDFNHPSVILYSIGNEIPEIGTDQGSAMAHELSTCIRNLDPTRFTTAAINGVFAAGDRVGEILRDLAAEDGNSDGNVNDFMTVMDTKMDQIVVHRAISERLEKACASLDVAGYNYMTARYEKDLAEHPNRVIVGSETYPAEIARNWVEVEKCPNVIGDFTWTGWDYIGEAGVGVPGYHPGEGGFGAVYPCQLAFCGDFDLIGNRRPASYYREIAFGRRTAPYLAVQDPAHFGEPVIKTPWVISDAFHTWTFPGFEGKKIVVEVYGRGKEAELFLNGRSLGREKIVQPCSNVIGNRCLFTLDYEPGTLEAVLYDEEGSEIGRDALGTTRAPAGIHAEADLFGDLYYVSLALVDEDGTGIDTKLHDTELAVKEMENVTLLGLGSGDPKPRHNYTEKVTDTFTGRALAVCRLADPDLPGRITVETKEGLRAEITIPKGGNKE